MSILIRGMEMPYGCADCDFCGGIIMPDGIYCCDCPTEASHGKNISDAINNDTRADFCPLIEVSESLFSADNARKFLRENPPKGETE